MPRKTKHTEAPEPTVSITEAMEPVRERIEEQKTHVERARFMVPPEGWIPAWTSSKIGLQVNKRARDEFHTVGIQFAKEPPAEVKEATGQTQLMGIRGPLGRLSYDQGRRRQQWELTVKDGEAGELVYQAKNLAKDVLEPMLVRHLAEERKTGVGR